MIYILLQLTDTPTSEKIMTTLRSVVCCCYFWFCLLFLLGLFLLIVLFLFVVVGFVFVDFIVFVVTYGCEAWTLTNRDEQYLRIFERRILRKIFGPVQNEDESWRIRMNYELSELVKKADIVRFIKSRRIAWLGHVMRMDEKRTPKRILEWKPIGRRIRGRPRKRWIEDIEDDIQIMGIRGWRKLCKERAEWKRITEKAKTHSGL